LIACIAILLKLGTLGWKFRFASGCWSVRPGLYEVETVDVETEWAGRAFRTSSPFARPTRGCGEGAPGAPPTVETGADIYALFDWPGGVMLYQATPLAEAARDVERRFGRTVDVVTEELRGIRVSGTLEDERFEEAVVSLCQTAGADCVLTDSGARIQP
jgi:hypothetical protein